MKLKIKRKEMINLERKYQFGHAYNPSEKEKEKNKELEKKYLYRAWLPESITPVGDSYVYFNNLEDLKNAPIGLSEMYDYVSKHNIKKNETLAFFNKNIINKLTIYEYLSELNNDMLDMLEVFIKEQREMRLCLEEEDED